MNTLELILALLGCCLLSAVFSGSETGFYRLSPLRVDAEAEAGSRSARLMRWLLADDARLLITILVGNNLMLQLCTVLAEDEARRLGVAPAFLELVVTAALAPFLFFFAELLPKDLFRRRPHTLVAGSVWIIAAARWLFLPLSLPLQLLARLLERLSGAQPRDLARVLGREKVLELLDEGARHGALELETHNLVHNVFRLRGTPVEKVMVPWPAVVSLDFSESPEATRERVARSRFTRLPALRGNRVVGYVHQLDVLSATEGPAPELHLRPLMALDPALTVERALARLRLAGQRAALVGTPGEPLGLLTLKDLVEEISGELAGW